MLSEKKEKERNYKREYMREYFKDPERWQKQKDRLKVKIKCDVCGIEISKGSKFSHEKTKKHINNLGEYEKKLKIEKLYF